MKIDIDPILIELGPIRLSWYGLMYVLGSLISYLLVLYQMKKKDFGISKPEVDDLYFYSIFGLIVGARLGYVLFYGNSSQGKEICRFNLCELLAFQFLI